MNYSTSSPVAGLLDRLDGVQSRGGDKWMARCPAHPDKSPSLSIRETADGRVLIYCFGGCSASDVVAAVGLELGDLFPPRDPLPGTRQIAPPLLSGYDAILALRHELMVVSIAAGDIAAGETLSQEDAERLKRTATRLERLITAASHTHGN